MNERLLEEIIKDVISSMRENKSETGGERKNNPDGPQSCEDCRKLTTEDYPIQEKHPELIKTPTGKKLDEITMEKVINGEITAKDIRVAPETLELQAQVAESAGRLPLAQNLRRAAELTVIPDTRILEIYNALRPHRSTKEELLAIAAEVETKFGATINADFIREAAEVYSDRNMLRTD
ncbi:diol dehydratase small subunit [Thermoactinomyces mirandus]|uniref:Diol dehydratase small subunit n=1 Tax=Thermoactinomyces mirandus TaxID=2756294 RepID=A0A7W2ASC0_9BACL|nr:diol dehydratase small subunit [Thermoactinomyces mirandus]MBA4603262.1 diol dehydratase small subunit [Thermoactinomyces mirandus]